jgi:DNA-binding GntR family transcriptional regulator
MTDLSLAEKAYSVIKKDILTCVLDPGSQIAQSQLVERYEFGVTPIRESLKRLEQEGFVRPIPRFGYIICPITINDIEDVYGVRMILETSAVKLAIQRASDEQLAKLQTKANFTYTFKDRESYLQFLEHNISFHVSIAMASGNRKLADLLSKVLNEMTRIFNLGLDLRDSAQEMTREHILLADALAGRALEKAIQIITDQIVLSRQRVMEEMTQRLGQRAMSEINL